MPEENDFLTDITRDGTKLDSDEQFKEVTEGNKDEEESETPEESSTENKEDGDKPSQEGEEAEDKPEKGEKADNTPDEEKPEPFHKHPRWQQMRSENEDLTAKVDELSGIVDELKDTPQSQGQQVTLPDWAAKAFGTDQVGQDIYKGLMSERKADREEIRKEILADQESQVAQQQTDQKKWDEWVDLEVQNLKDSGKSFDKNELIKIAVEYQPTGEDGNISLDKAYEILSFKQAQKGAEGKDNMTARKKIASDTTSNSQGEQTPSNEIDPAVLRRKSFSALVQGD